MDFSFVKALEDLGADATFRIANEARPEGRYLFNSILPERKQESYSVESGKMIVRATMAGLVAMDSPYPIGGHVEVNTFNERSFKVGNQVPLSEEAVRTLQRTMQRLKVVSGSSTDALTQEALNFYNKVILQPQFDMSEWLRAQVLQYGALNFTFNGKEINVTYGVPVANLFDTRVTAGAATAYGAANSSFWADIRLAKKTMKGGIKNIIMNTATKDEIVYNSANSIRVLEEAAGFTRIQRMVTENNIFRPSEDARDQVRIVIYDQEYDLKNAAANTVENQKFMKDGKIVITGENIINGYEVGQGSTPDPENGLELGYHHIAPTVEGGGIPGRWGRLYTPQGKPWQLIGEAASNQMPVLLAPKKLIVLTTEMAA